MARPGMMPLFQRTRPNCVSCATAVQNIASLGHLYYLYLLSSSSCLLLPVGILAAAIARRLPGAHYRIAESLRHAYSRIAKRVRAIRRDSINPDWRI